MSSVRGVHGGSGRVDANGSRAVLPFEGIVGKRGQGLDRFQCAAACGIDAVDGCAGGLFCVCVYDVEGWVERDVARAVSGRGFDPWRRARSEPACRLVELELVDCVGGRDMRHERELVRAVCGDAVRVERGFLSFERGAARSAVCVNWVDGHHARKEVGGEEESSRSVCRYVTCVRFQFQFADLGGVSGRAVYPKAHDGAVAAVSDLLVQTSSVG